MNALVRKNATKARHPQHKHVAIVLRGGAIMSVGHNYDSVHAEVAALSRLWPDQRKGCKVWSLRVRKHGQYGLAKPCPKCQQFMRENGIKTVFYSDAEGVIVKMKL